MLEVSSNKNPMIKEVRSLYKKKNRWANKLFIIEGIKIIEEAIINQIEIKYILFSSSFIDSQEGKNFYYKIQDKAHIVKVKDSLFKSLSDTENPQGVMAVCQFNIRDLAEIESLSNPSIFFLDGLQDPGNMGTIIRTADAFKIDGIILGQGCVDPYNLKVVRSTMGSIFRVPLYSCHNSLETLAELKNKGFNILTATLEGEPIYNFDFKDKLVCIIGNEARGVNPKILHMANKSIKIPMPGDAESLNAAVAASIIMYELMKSRI